MKKIPLLLLTILMTGCSVGYGQMPSDSLFEGVPWSYYTLSIQDNDHKILSITDDSCLVFYMDTMKAVFRLVNMITEAYDSNRELQHRIYYLERENEIWENGAKETLRLNKEMLKILKP